MLKKNGGLLVKFPFFNGQHDFICVYLMPAEDEGGAAPMLSQRLLECSDVVWCWLLSVKELWEELVQKIVGHGRVHILA